MRKASRRAKKTFPRVKKIADTFKADYIKELGRVDDFLGLCSFHKNQLGVVSVQKPANGDPPQKLVNGE